MKALLLPAVLAGAFLAGIASAGAAAEWQTDYQTALKIAQKENRVVLADFTGSDWCPPCILMKKRVLDTEAFERYAAEHLVLLEVDFPQQKPITPQEQSNRLALARKLGIADPMTGEPVFPTLVLVAPNGKVLASNVGAFFSVKELLGWIDLTLSAAKS